MKLHLPVRLFKSVLACFTAIAGLTVGSGVAWADAQDLTFSGASLTWNTAEDNKAFVDAEDAAASFAEGDNVSFTATSEVSLGEHITAGVVAIESGADVTIDLGDYTLEAEKMVLSGTLDMGGSFTVGSGDTLEIAAAGAVLDSALVMQEKGWLHLDAAVNLNNNDLTLSGKSGLILTATGDGRVYDLVTGISALKDAVGNALVLDSSNNAIANYFDTSLPGSGFWADATLQLTEDGTLQLVRHNETVQPAITITTRQTGSVNYSYYEGVTFKDLTSSSGGAIDANDVMLCNNGAVTFSGNTPFYYYGGAISASTVTLSGNGAVTFSGNTASSEYGLARGGAIYADEGTVELSGNGAVTFSGNTASDGSYAYGGAIYADEGTVELSGNEVVTFSGNTASGGSYAYGGAIDADEVTLSGNGAVIFSGNTASSTSSSAYGGAIYASGGTVTLSGNGAVTFSENTASGGRLASGGAISADVVTLSDNGAVTFSGNTASSTSFPAYGGAIYADEGTATLSGNGAVTFSGNTASSTASNAYGGAIDANEVTLSDNEVVTFSGNTASSEESSAYGGAIDARSGTVTLCNNGAVTFSGNTASSTSSSVRGGAIYAEDGTVTLSGNGDVTFIGNTASGYYANGGAIDASGGTVTLSGNGDVLFEKNAEVSNDTYRLRSVYTGALNLAASDGKRIEFRDSIYASGTVKLNEGGAGNIIFTGATTEADLLSVKGSAGTDSEIANSRLSALGHVELFGGSLMVQHQATLQTEVFMVKQAADATLELENGHVDARHFIVDSGNTLSLKGKNTLSTGYGKIDGTMQFAVESTHAENALVSYSGFVDLSESSFDIQSTQTTASYQLLSLQERSVVKWNDDLAYTASGIDSSRLVWKDGVLYWDISGNVTESKQVLGDYIFSTDWTLQHVTDKNQITGTGRLAFCLDSDVEWDGLASPLVNDSSSHVFITGEQSADGKPLYSFDFNHATSSAFNVTSLMVADLKEVTFSGNSADRGGAISADVVTLSGNGDVTFSGNSAVYRGGAIDASGGTVTLSGNGDVTFSGNTVSAEDGWIYGGAILASSVMLSENENVSFIGNTALSEYYGALGGAIYAAEVTLRENGNVSFIGNTASNSGGAIYAHFDTVELSGNGDVTFSGNRASGSSAYGGAISAEDGTVTLSGNGDVLFEKNAEKSGSLYRLRSIYTKNLNLSASEGKKIEFRDSIYASGTVKLNENYTDAEGVTHKQTGDIIFTGATTAADLRAVKGSSGTADEITNSRTSIVKAMTTLYGGRLLIEDGAVYQGAGLTVHENSAATVLLKDAKMTHTGKEVFFAAGTTLAAAGVSQLTADTLTLADGAALLFEVSAVNETSAVLTYSGDMTLEGGLTLKLTAAEGLDVDGRYMLLSGVSQTLNWEQITVSGGVWDKDDLVWMNGVLYVNYCTEATWNNASGDGYWNAESMNWEQDDINFAYKNGVDVIFGNESSGTVVLEGALAPESVLVENSAGRDYVWNADATEGGKLTGGMNLTKQGDGTLTINTANDYTGGTEINGGSLIAGSDTAFGTGEVVLNEGTLDLTDKDITNNIIANGGTLEGATKYVGNLTVAGNLVVGDNTTANSIAVNKGDISGGSLINTDITYKGDSNTSADIADESSVTVESGGVTLSGNNSYNGGTEINGGSLAAGSDTAFGTGDVTLNAGTLALNVMAITNNIIAYGGMLDGATNYGGDLTVNGDLVVGDNTTANSITVTQGDITGGSLTNTDITYKGDSNTSADITGDSSVTVEDGDVCLSGNNSYTGGTEVNGGSLSAGSDTAFGAGDVTLNDGKLDLNGMGVGNDIIANGGTLDGATNYACALTVNGDLVVGDSTTANSITVNKGDITGGSLTNTDITYKGDSNTSADITGDSSVTVEDGAVTLSGNNSYTGGTEINGGSLAAGSDTAFGMGDVMLNAGTLALNGMAITNNIIVYGGILNGATQYGGNLTVAGDLEVGDNTTANSITVNKGDISGGSLTNTDITYTGDSNTSADITGASSVTVETGYATLSGDNSYTGGTVVNGGRLTVNSDTAIGSGDVTVNGGTLELNVKSISNDVFFNGGVLSGGSLDGVAITAQAGTLNSAITGESSLRVISGGVGDVILTAYNEYQGGTVVSGGTLVAASESGFALGYGAVEVNGGTLRLDAAVNYILSTLNGTDGVLNLNGKTLYTVGYDHGSYAGAVQNGTWDMSATEAIQSFTGKVENVAFVVGSGSTLELLGETTLSTAVANSGTVTFGGTVTLNMEAEGDIETLYMNAAGEIAENGYAAERKTHLVVDGGLSSAADNTIWKENGVELLETVYDNGRLTSILRDLGTYYINSGSETVQDASIFGDAAISLKSGTLNLNGVTLANDIVATGGTLSGATSYGGQLTVDGTVKLDGTTTAESVLLNSGSLSGGSLSDTQVLITGDVTLSSRLESGVDITVESGTSTLTGTINNNFNGSVVINGGLLEAKSSLPTGVLLGTGSVELNGDGVLKLGNNLNVSSLRGTGGGVQLNGKTLTITGSAETEYAGQIAGNTGKMVLNAGALNLSGAAQMDTMTVSESAQLNLHGNMMQVNTLTNANKVTLADGTQGAPASLQVGSGLTVRNQQGKVAELNGVSASGNTLSGGSMSHAEIYLGGGAAPVSMMSLADAATYTLEDAALVATNVMVATELAVLNNVTMDSESSLSAQAAQISVSNSALHQVTLGAAASIAATNSTLSGANCLTLTPQTVSLDGNQMMLSSSQLSGLTLLDGGTLTLDLSYVDLPDAYTPGDYLVLLKLDNFNLEAAYQESLGDSVEWLDIQGGVLGGAIEQTVTISYVQDSTGIVVSMAGLNVPEPTTATLSLLALAALAARRRRK